MAATAVILGANLGGLGVARSLRKGGVQVTMLDRYLRLPGMWTHGCRRVQIPSFGPSLVDTLTKLRQDYHEPPVLFLANEFAVYVLSEHLAKVDGLYHFRLPSRENVDALSDKSIFQREAEDAFPLPRSVVIESEDDVKKLSQLAFPVIVKPTDKRLMHIGKAPRISFLHTWPQAAKVCHESVSTGVCLIAQEWVPGTDDLIYFTLFYTGRGGSIESFFVGKKLAADPPQIGSTAICTAAPEAREALEPITRRLIERFGFFGMGSVEYKWHDEQKKFFIIEPTVGRVDWQEEIATLCGENIPLKAYRYEVGLPQETSTVRNAAWRQSVYKRWPRGMPPCTLYDSAWRRDDPVPAFVHYVVDRLFPPSKLET